MLAKWINIVPVVATSLEGINHLGLAIGGTTSRTSNSNMLGIFTNTFGPKTVLGSDPSIRGTKYPRRLVRISPHLMPMLSNGFWCDPDGLQYKECAFSLQLWNTTCRDWTLYITFCYCVYRFTRAIFLAISEVKLSWFEFAIRVTDPVNSS